jgi:hypothetical protein
LGWRGFSTFMFFWRDLRLFDGVLEGLGLRRLLGETSLISFLGRAVFKSPLNPHFRERDTSSPAGAGGCAEPCADSGAHTPHG